MSRAATESLVDQMNLLLDKAKGGDERARERLFTLLRPGLLLMARARLRGGLAGWIEDAVQETLLVLARKLNTICDQPHVYAAGVLRNKVGKIYRDGQPIPTNSLLQEAVRKGEWYDPIIWGDFTDPLLREHISKVFKTLESSCQDLIAALARGVTVAELYELHPDVNQNTVRYRKKMCLGQFAELLKRAPTQPMSSPSPGC